MAPLRTMSSLDLDLDRQLDRKYMQVLAAAAALGSRGRPVACCNDDVWRDRLELCAGPAALLSVVY